MFFMLLAHARARVSERTFVIKVMTLDDDVIDDDAHHDDIYVTNDDDASSPFF